jgi:hypothetical protein
MAASRTVTAYELKTISNASDDQARRDRRAGDKELFEALMTDG